MERIQKNDICRVLTFIVIIYSSCINNTLAQREIEVDSATIAYKAKLLTVFRKGLSDSTSLINDLQKQELKFLPSPFPDFIFMKIHFNQKYNKGRMRSVLFGSCSYYLAYNTKNYTFYRLGGFSSIDIDALFNENKRFATDIILHYASDLDYVHEINFLCLLTYFQASKVKRARKGYSCLNSCEDEISEYLYIR